MKTGLIKTHPILFSPEMVAAIESGNKTQTRRIAIKSQFPFGKIGSILWVRETHYRFGHWKKNGQTKKGNQKWSFVPVEGYPVLYDNVKPIFFKKSRDKVNPDVKCYHKRLARFMPKSECRIFLEITAYRKEKLQDISQEDAKCEGTFSFRHRPGGTRCRSYVGNSLSNDCYVCGFRVLWNRINGFSKGWDANPDVWVIEFKKKVKSEK